MAQASISSSEMVQGAAEEGPYRSGPGGGLKDLMAGPCESNWAWPVRLARNMPGQTVEQLETRLVFVARNTSEVL